MDLSVSTLIQSFAPGFEIIETPIPTLNDDLEVTNCIYVDKGLEVISFTVKVKKSTQAIEFKIGTTKYFASGPNDKLKICDFLTHLEILGQDLIFKYSQISKYLHAIPSNNSLSNYLLVGKNENITGTLCIKNDRFIFEYKDISKYTYPSLQKLLANPLISQFKKSNLWFW